MPKLLVITAACAVGTVFVYESFMRLGCEVLKEDFPQIPPRYRRKIIRKALRRLYRLGGSREIRFSDVDERLVMNIIQYEADYFLGK